MQHKKIYQLLASAALVTALPLCALAQGKEPVKVGLVSSKSGVFAEQGEEVMRAVKFAIEEANSKGGVDGRKVEVQEGDDESTPDAGRRVAEKMARDGHNLLIGAVPSSISLAIASSPARACRSRARVSTSVCVCAQPCCITRTAVPMIETALTLRVSLSRMKPRSSSVMCQVLIALSGANRLAMMYPAARLHIRPRS